MTQEEILQIFQENGAILEGHFLLTSGLHSTEYLQCARVLQCPEVATKLCRRLAEAFKADRPDLVIGPALGGIVVAYEVARALGVRGIFAERKEGKMLLRRGFDIKPQEKVLVVEDVLTTGGSVKEVIKVAENAGGNVIGVAALVDRAKEKLDFGVKFTSLIKVNLPAYEPQNCPLCKKGLAVVKPGSRK